MFQYSLTERTVPRPVSVPRKRFWRFRFRVRFLGKRFRRFRFPVPVRFLGHVKKALVGSLLRHFGGSPDSRFLVTFCVTSEFPVSGGF